MPVLIPMLSFFPRFSDIWYLITQDVTSSLLQYIPPMYRNRTRTVPLQKKKNEFFFNNVNKRVFIATKSRQPQLVQSVKLSQVRHHVKLKL